MYYCLLPATVIGLTMEVGGGPLSAPPSLPLRHLLGHATVLDIIIPVGDQCLFLSIILNRFSFICILELSSQLERHVRLVIVIASLCMVTWLIITNGKRWQDRLYELQQNHPRDFSDIKPHPTSTSAAKLNQYEYTNTLAMKWTPALIRNLTHPFTDEMSCYGLMRVIPSLYKKQLTAEQRQAEGNIYMPGRDVIVANTQKTLHRLPKARFKVKPTLTGKEMAAIKNTIRSRLDEHAQRLNSTPLTFNRSRLPPALLYIDPKVCTVIAWIVCS